MLGGAAGGAAGAGAGAAPAMMFLPDNLSNLVYRFAIGPDRDPVLVGTIPVELATGPALSPTGELFVAAYSAAGTISRFLSPTGTPVANGTFVPTGASYPEELVFVDDELWLVGTADHACTTEAQGIVRVGFDTQGMASVVGTLKPAGLIGADRAVLWLPATRDLYVSQCYPVNVIQHYRVAADHTVTPLAALGDERLENPHGMVVTPWGELLVAQVGHPSGGNVILRYTLDADGNATPNGSITGGGLSSPVGLALAPWGELYAVNQGDATISRFTFDAAHAAVPKPTSFALNAPTNVTKFGVGWIAIAATP